MILGAQKWPYFGPIFGAILRPYFMQILWYRVFSSIQMIYLGEIMGPKMVPQNGTKRNHGRAHAWLVQKNKITVFDPKIISIWIMVNFVKKRWVQKTHFRLDTFDWKIAFLTTGPKTHPEISWQGMRWSNGCNGIHYVLLLPIIYDMCVHLLFPRIMMKSWISGWNRMILGWWKIPQTIFNTKSCRSHDLWLELMASPMP